MIVYACSSNRGKLREFALASDERKIRNLTIEPLPGLAEISPPEEDGATFEDNAALKARFYSQFTPEIVLADDSGLEVDALGGAPGVHSARFAGPDATDEQNNRLLLERLQGRSDRTARFVCVIALAQAGRILTTARGTVEGQILHAPRGSGGFGYDPLFYYAPYGTTLAEVDAERKFAVSHRGQAVRAVLDWLAARGDAAPGPRSSLK